MSVQTPASAIQTVAAPRASVVAQALLAVVFGFFLVGTAGFSHMDVIHNAGHDTRHSNAFPCH
jgi:cobalt transporter subunit CbtB